MSGEGRRVLVSGRSGSGKTTFTQHALKKERRYVIFDPRGEYGRLVGVETVAKLASLHGALAHGWRGARGFKVAYRPPAAREAEALHHLSLMLKGFAEKANGGALLVVEEMNLSFPVTAWRADLWGFADLCSRGRHYGIDLIGVTQRPAEVNTRFRGNLTHVFAFALGADVRDLAAMTALFGQEHREALRALTPHEFLAYRDGKVERGRNPPRK